MFFLCLFIVKPARGLFDYDMMCCRCTRAIVITIITRIVGGKQHVIRRCEYHQKRHYHCLNFFSHSISISSFHCHFIYFFVLFPMKNKQFLFLLFIVVFFHLSVFRICSVLAAWLRADNFFVYTKLYRCLQCYSISYSFCLFTNFFDLFLFLFAADGKEEKFTGPVLRTMNEKQNQIDFH